jgi:hypothetical protein
MNLLLALFLKRSRQTQHKTQWRGDVHWNLVPLRGALPTLEDPQQQYRRVQQYQI